MKQPEGLRSSCALVVRGLAVALIGCNSGDEAGLDILSSSLELGSAVVIADSAVMVRFDSAFAPLTVRARRGGFAALDPKSHQLVLLDSTLREQSRVGRMGGGPGELRGAVRLEPWSRGLAVGESVNGRISLFTPRNASSDPG